MNTDNTTFRSSKREDNGNQEPPPKRPNTLYFKLTVCTIIPSTEQGIQWMHAVCGYPVNSTWLKAIIAGNFIGWHSSTCGM